MTESRANRVNENGIWRYLDQDDAEFVCMSQFDYPIEAVDDFIDGLHGVTLPEETIDLLRGMRHDGLQAYIGKNIALMEAHLRGLHMACRAAGMLDAARIGVKFKRGRKPNTPGPVRKAIAKLLAKSPELKNPDLWKAIEAKPPRGWQVFDNRAGRYIEGPKAGPHMNMSYARFCTVASEERKKRNG
ncbi:hypothetical protein [Aromatoleum bremense]|uniref:Uncharacterized protein n=1 Tax=Aromatoleum bremense TaxID=76115 RepID=A0ABX1NU12_9RHOO|nr:hypothetical protein [Aromatoleum bremense]NMG15508.1 hypothetical protein [Aromatoleum bremense]QTQ31547.1 Uncharacterized protein pbN1_15560 [Aromatoleum bremense]